MAATATSLSPGDNRDLLGAIAAAFAASRQENQRALYQAKRDVVLALGDHPVLIAVREGLPLAEPGPSGRVMIAFTDDEAAAAWTESRHPAAPQSEPMPSAELSHGGPSRKQWLQWLGQLGASSVALNPAGPLGSVVHADELRAMRPRMLRRGRAQADHPWLDVGVRQAERERAGRLLEALRAAIAHGDQAAFRQVRPELPTVNDIGSLLWAAELQVLSGRYKLAEGNARDGLHQMVYGSFGWGRFGDPYTCTDGLLEAGGLLLERRRSPPQRPGSSPQRPGSSPQRPGSPPQDGEWQDSYLQELCDALERTRTDYRDQDAAQLLAAAREQQ